MRAVSVYVICPDDEAQGVVEKLQNVVIGFGLEGYEAGMAIEPRDDEDVIIFTADDLDD
jgi:hypothetical protein